MEAALFSMLLKAAASGFVSGAASRVGSWLLGNILDTDAACGRCGERAARRIPNRASSRVVCPSCHNAVSQYTNATTHTINRNGSIAAAYISNIHWDDWGDSLGEPFNPHFAVDVVNSKYESVVARLTLSQFRGSVFYSDDMILKPESDRYFWDSIWWKIRTSHFPDAGGTFAIDMQLFNLWGDELHCARALGNHSTRR